MTARRIAHEALMRITEGGAYANLCLKEALSGIPENDAKWVSALVYTTLDHLLYLDFIISHYAKGRLHPKIRSVLRLGACQALFMHIPDSACCNESVKLAKEIGKEALSGYVNGVMRHICAGKENPPPLPDDTCERFSIQYSYPRYLVDGYVKEYGGEFTEKMLAHSQRGMTLRAVAPYTKETLEGELSKRNISFTNGMLDDAVKIRSGFDVTRDALFIDGKITVQSESAMLSCRALDVKPHARVLDACAAPGGKTAYISQLMGGTGHIMAWDIHAHRVALTEKTLARLHVKNVKIERQDATCRRDDLIEAFDAVLIDAPCSGLGIPGKPDARYARDKKLIEEVAGLQLSILNACAPYVRRDGILVYSTCTIQKRENEENIWKFLEQNPVFSLDSLSPFMPQSMHERASGGFIQLFPHVDDTEGFFIARLWRA